MAEICGRCRQEIRFRWIEERVVPLGCACASRSKGYVSKPIVVKSSPNVGTRSRTVHRLQAGDERSRPTKCPVCKRDVYFVRHNGGVVWFESLGWPWPKHTCVKLQRPKGTHERILGYSEQHKSLQVGLVIEAEEGINGPGGRIAVRCASGTVRHVCMLERVSVRPLLGELVALADEEGKLFRLSVRDEQWLPFTNDAGTAGDDTGQTRRVVFKDVPGDRFQTGDILHHPRYGVCTVLATSRVAGYETVQVRFKKGRLREYSATHPQLILLDRPGDDKATTR